MSGLGTKLRVSAATGFRSAIVVAVSILAMTVVRVLINGLFDGHWGADWRLAFELAAIFAGGWFLLVFTYTFFKLRANEPVDRILTERHHARLSTPMSGFVGMEYYGLILNRTFVVFIAPDGLHGWKAEGAVDCSSPMFFAPYEQMLKDHDLMTNPDGVRKLGNLKGGFFIPREQIAAVEPVYKQKWGMGAIPHSGRIRVRMVSGKSREFILLGNADADTIQQSIMHGALVPTATKTPVVEFPYVARHSKKLWVPMLGFWIAFSGFFLLHPTDTWTNGNWAYRVTTAVIIASPVLLLLEFVVQKLTFTESGIERTTRLGRTVAYPYETIKNFSPVNDAFLRIEFEDGRTLKVHSWLGDPSKMLSILKAKSGKGVGAFA
jgi:hypothetical protein